LLPEGGVRVHPQRSLSHQTFVDFLFGVVFFVPALRFVGGFFIEAEMSATVASRAYRTLLRSSKNGLANLNRQDMSSVARA
jgi:hypothetical protein